jgi:hypothetical protein
LLVAHACSPFVSTLGKRSRGWKNPPMKELELAGVSSFTYFVNSTATLLFPSRSLGAPKLSTSSG